MGIDPLSAVAPARVKALIIPYAPIRQSRFLSFVARLEKENVVQLGDVSPDGRPHRTMFSPLAFPKGSVLFDLSTCSSSPSHLALAPFELYREPLVVMAIFDGVDTNHGADLQRAQSIWTDKEENIRTLSHNNLHGILSGGLEKLQIDFPKALVHQIIIFDNKELNVRLPEGVLIVPSPEKSNITTIKTLMCDVTSNLLAEMTAYAKSLQALPTLESPKQARGSTGSAGQLSAGDSGRLFSPSSERTGGMQRSLSAQRSSPISRSTNPEGQEGLGVVRPPPTTFDDIAGVSVSSSAFRLSHDNSKRSGSQDRISTHGFGAGSIGERERSKGKGRIGVVMGSLYLLAGRWADAVRELSESATIAKANSDYLWHAKSLDYILVCLLMYAWAGMDFRIPQILFPGVEKPTSSSAKASGHTPSNSVPELTSAGLVGAPNRSISLQNLTDLLPDLVNNILNLYARAWTFTEDKLPQLAFSESTIRFAKLLTVINLSGGVLKDDGLRHIVLNMGYARVQFVPLQPTSFPTRAELTSFLFRAFPAPSTSSVVRIEDRTVILAAIASVLSELGYHRKTALVLKELLSALIPALVQARKEGAAEMGFHPAASLASINATTRATMVNDTHGQHDIEHELQSFLALICHVYGISGFQSDASKADPHFHDKDDETHRVKRSPQDLPEAIAARVIRQAALKCVGNQHLKLEVLRSCIGVCEALPDLEGVLRFSAEMLRTAGSGIAPGPETTDGSPTLPIEDQVRLVAKISRTMGIVQQLGKEDLGAEYWDEFLVRVIELVEANPAKVPVAHAKADLATVKAIDATEQKSTFIYNPFIKSRNPILPRAVLVAEEEAVFRVTLQNLYDLDVEVERISLESNGLPFNSSSQGTVIGPYGTQTVLLGGVPRKSGSLTVTGCRVKIRGCRERSFPIFNKAWIPKVDVKIVQPGILTSLANNTQILPEGTGSNRGRKPSDLPGPKATVLDLDVIGAQPNVILKSTSLPQSAIMLLEGETKIFKVTLQNTSSVASDVLFLSFNDSTSSQPRPSSTENKLSAVEAYELDYASCSRPSLRWRRAGNDQNVTIAPKMETTLEIEMLGKPGLSFGTIQVDYGHLGDSSKEASDKFYTRQMTIPLTVTVNASIELVRTELLPFTSDFAWHNIIRQNSNPPRGAETTAPQKSPQNGFQSLLSRIGLNSQDESHCLLLLDLRNSWPSPLAVSIQIRSPKTPKQPSIHLLSTETDSWERAYTAHEPIQPGHISRIILILPRIYIPNPYAPVPSLRSDSEKRQFILSTAPKPAPEAELATREAFHYRETLLSHIRATWAEDSTCRKGNINLRALHLTTRMVSVLRLDDLEIGLSIHPSSSPPSSSSNSINNTTIHQLSPSKYVIPTSTFLTLRTTLTNRSPDPIHPLLRLQPALANQPHNIALDLSKKFLWSGLLQRALPILASKQTTSVDLPFLVLCNGVFELGAVVEEVRVLRSAVVAQGADNGIVDGPLAAAQRRVWGVRERCVIVAKDFEENGE